MWLCTCVFALCKGGKNINNLQANMCLSSLDPWHGRALKQNTISISKENSFITTWVVVLTIGSLKFYIVLYSLTELLKVSEHSDVANNKSDGGKILDECV